MIAVIADDLTGAAEIAGLGWRHGLTAEILQRDQMPSDIELAVFDSDSRNCPAKEAARRVSRIAKRIRKRKPAWIYKKVDSVLRGNVLVEIQAMQEALGLTCCLLVPANPSARRIIKNGKYFIQGKPINRTDFRNDPSHPRHSADVKELLGASRDYSVTLQQLKASDLPYGMVVGEATTVTDVRHWGQRVNAQTLPAGGADFFAALLQSHGLRSQESGSMVTKTVAGRTLFVSGSMAQSSVSFLHECNTRKWPVLLMPDELFAGRGSARTHQATWSLRIVDALKRHPKVVVGIGKPQRPGRREGLRLGTHLTTTIRRVLAKMRVDRVCVEGGATAALLLEQLGWTRLVVDCEFATGVTGVRPQSRKDVLLVLKPGSYAWPDCLCSEAATGG